MGITIATCLTVKWSYNNSIYSQVMSQGRVGMASISQLLPPHISSMHSAMPSLEQQQQLMNDAIEKARRAAELQKKIQEQLASKPNLVNSSVCLHVSSIYRTSQMDNSSHFSMFSLLRPLIAYP